MFRREGTPDWIFRPFYSFLLVASSFALPASLLKRAYPLTWSCSYTYAISFSYYSFLCKTNNLCLSSSRLYTFSANSSWSRLSSDGFEVLPAEVPSSEISLYSISTRWKALSSSFSSKKCLQSRLISSSLRLDKCSKFDPLRVSLDSAIGLATLTPWSNSASKLFSESVWFLRFSLKLAGRITLCSVDLCDIERSTEFEAVCFYLELPRFFDFMFSSLPFFFRWMASSLAHCFRARMPRTSAYNLTSPSKLL